MYMQSFYLKYEYIFITYSLYYLCRTCINTFNHIDRHMYLHIYIYMYKYIPIQSTDYLNLLRALPQGISDTSTLISYPQLPLELHFRFAAQIPSSLSLWPTV